MESISAALQQHFSAQFYVPALYRVVSYDMTTEDCPGKMWEISLILSSFFMKLNLIFLTSHLHQVIKQKANPVYLLF